MKLRMVIELDLTNVFDGLDEEEIEFYKTKELANAYWTVLYNGAGDGQFEEDLDLEVLSMEYIEEGR